MAVETTTAAVAATKHGQNNIDQTRPHAAGAKSYRLRFIDVIIIGCGLALTIMAGWLVYAGPAPASLIIQAAGRDYVYPLSVDTIISIPGSMGITIIEIKNNAARFVEAPCRNKTCISSGWLRSTGGWSACLPNTVFLRIEGSKQADDTIDAILY